MKKLLFASAFAALSFAAHAADLEPVDVSWIDEVAPASHRAMVTLSLAATYFDMDAANGFASGIFSGGNFLDQSDNGFSFDTWGVSGDFEAWLPTNASHYFIGGLEGAWVEGNHNSEVTTDVDLFTFSIDESLNPIALGGTFFSPFEIS